MPGQAGKSDIKSHVLIFKTRFPYPHYHYMIKKISDIHSADKDMRLRLNGSSTGKKIAVLRLISTRIDLLQSDLELQKEKKSDCLTVGLRDKGRRVKS